MPIHKIGEVNKLNNNNVYNKRINTIIINGIQCNLSKK
jgi:hypothetical protein